MRSWILLMALVLTSCTTPRFASPAPEPEVFDAAIEADSIEHAKRLRAHEDRVLALSWKLRLLAAPHCPEQAPGIGLDGASRQGNDHSPFWRAYYEHYGVGKDATILALVPDGPLERAGARVGDEIVRIGSKRVDSFRFMLKALYRVHPDDPFELTLRRDGVEQVVGVDPEPVCRAFVVITFDAQTQTTTNSVWGDVQVSIGTLEFVESDDELAAMIAHELGHAIAGDRGEQTESIADRVGLTLSAMAGHDPTVTAEMWIRRAIESPISLRAWPKRRNRAHDDVARRLPLIRRHSAELADRIEAGDTIELPPLPPR